MYPRRHLLPLLSALALLLAPFALAPKQAEAAEFTYYVDTLSDTSGPTSGCTEQDADGDCSLRQALTLAGATNATDVKTISFDLVTSGLVGGSEPWEFIVNSPDGRFPEIKSNTLLDADIVTIPRIVVNGNGQDVVFNLTGSNNQISGLSIIGATSSGGVFRGTGIYISGGNNLISRNYIGIRPNGAAAPNFTGLQIDGGSNNTIGITGGPVVANYLSGNTQNGIIIRNAANNVLVNNIVGLYVPSFSPFTLASRPNGEYGVQITSFSAGTSQSNRVGGTTPALANIIGGNGQAGIQLSGTGTTSNTIQVNYIGIDRDTDADLGNSGDGIRIEDGASNNTIGVLSSPLVVSGNTGYGVLIRPNGVNPPNGNRFTGQIYIGTNRAGTNAVPNDLGGMRIDGGNAGASNNVIQGSGNSLRIAGNGGIGVQIVGATAQNNRIEGALIGLTPAGNPAGSTLLPNVQGGVLVNNARATTLAGNTISGNNLFGVRLTGALTTTLTGNFIGLSLNREVVQGNAGPGVDVQTSRNTLIGGVSSADNFIAGNVGPAIALSGTQATNTFSTTVRGNQIGLIQQAGPSTFYLERGPNSGEGVRVSGTVRQLTLDSNFIAAAADTTATDYPAILVQGDSSSNPVTGGLSATNVATVTISGNRIGWLPAAVGSSLLAFPNADGVVVNGRAQNINILTNTIRLNVGAAVRLSDVLTVTVRANNPVTRNIGGGIIAGGASRNLILASNVIIDSGRSPAGLVVNAAADGIFLDGAATLTGAQILSNTLRTNTGRGIALQGDVNRATMRFNKLAQNGGAIKLVASTVYPGSGADPDTQATPNHGIDGPIVDLNFVNPLSLRINQSGVIEGYVYTSTVRTESGLTPASACITCTIQVFRPETLTSTEEQGWLPLTTLPESGGSTPRDLITVAANGRFVARLLSPLPKRLLFIATDGFGNSSEFTTLPLTASLLLEPISALATSAAPGDTVTYTLRLRNNGTVGYSNLRLATGGTLARWGLTTVPITSTDFAVAAGASRLVTVTLKLPTGSDPNVAFGKKDTTTITITGSPPPVTVTARLETTVLARPVISVTPRSSLGSGKPQTAVPHAFTIKNDGNVTVTLNLAYRTVDPANSPGVWSTSINSTTLTLGPGKDARLGLSVTVPAGALQNVSATTFLTATLPASVTPPYPAQTIVFSATTRADLNANADIFPEVEAQGVAEGQVILTHNVENKSNGTAKFCLDYFTSGQSRVRFESATNGFVVDSQGCFTLYAGADVNPALGRYSLAQFRAIVTIDRRLTTGNIETVTIFLRRGSPTGETISDALVEDRILITGGIKVPRMWLPLIYNAGTQ